MFNFITNDLSLGDIFKESCQPKKTKNAYVSSIFQHFSWNLCIDSKYLRSTNNEDLYNWPVSFSKWVCFGGAWEVWNINSSKEVIYLQGEGDDSWPVTSLSILENCNPKLSMYSIICRKRNLYHTSKIESTQYFNLYFVSFVKIYVSVQLQVADMEHSFIPSKWLAH